MPKHLKTIFTLIILTIISGCGLNNSDIENPDYRVTQQKGSIEHRVYQPAIVAQVVVAGEREEALNEGFKLIADYIFGNNKKAQKIAMTTPVENQAVNEKIAMTAPVDQQGTDTKNKWIVRFYMPKSYSIDNLPRPMNKQVKIQTLASKEFVVIRFSGRMSESNLSAHLNKLDDYIQKENIKVLKPHKYAFYNPPWTLPFMRRNEIMYQVEK